MIYRNGRPYLYRSVRKGGRVTSEYRGSGETARLIGAWDAMDAIDRDDERSRVREERNAHDELERALDELAERGRFLAHEALTAAGFHQHHRGEWRQRRGERHGDGEHRQAGDGSLGDATTH